MQRPKEWNQYSRASRTCEGDATVFSPNGLSPSIVAIGPPGLSQIRPLVWPAPLTRGFCIVCAIARVTCLMQLIGPKPIPSSFHHSGASIEYSSVPIRPAARAPWPKMLGHTYRHTSIARPTIFQRPTRRNLRAWRLRSLYAQRFWTTGRHCISHCFVSKSLTFYLSNFVGFGTHDPSTIDQGARPWSSHGLSGPNGVFPVPIRPSIPTQNAKESNHVPRATGTCHMAPSVLQMAWLSSWYWPVPNDTFPALIEPAVLAQRPDL